MPLAAPVTSTRIALPPGRFDGRHRHRRAPTETSRRLPSCVRADAITLKDSVARRRHATAAHGRAGTRLRSPARGYARVAHVGDLARDGRVARGVDLPPCLCPNWAPGRGT